MVLGALSQGTKDTLKFFAFSATAFGLYNMAHKQTQGSGSPMGLLSPIVQPLITGAIACGALCGGALPCAEWSSSNSSCFNNSCSAHRLSINKR